MAHTQSVIWQAVRLDWRLAASECRSSGQDLGLAAGAGAIVLAMVCESAWSTGALLAARPQALVILVVAAYVWAMCGAAAVLSLVTGVHRTTGQIASSMRLHPVSRWQSFVVTQCLALAGRYLAVIAVVALPLFCLAARALDVRGFAVVAIVSVLVLRLVPAVLHVAIVVARALRPVPLALICAGMVAALMTLPSMPGGRDVVNALPPHAAARVAVAPDAAASWALLMVWTVAIGALEWLASVSNRTAAIPPAGGMRISPLPMPVIALARAFAVDAALLHGELVRLVRWRRFWPTCATATFIVVLFARQSAAPGIVPTLVALLVFPGILGAMMGNLFGPDRAGVQAYWLALPRPVHALRAKIAAIALFAAGGIALALGAVLVAGSRPLRSADVYALLMASAFVVWSSASGRVASLLFPSAVDPNALGAGSVVRGGGTVIVLVCNGLFLAAAVGLAFLHDTQRIGEPVLLVAGVAVALLAFGLAGLVARATSRILPARREHLLNALGTSTTLS